MTVPGFYFSKLEARGQSKKTAEIKFKKGLNVISGASDTGKSYIFQCLNFMTGATKPPKTITEAAGYDSLWLEITTWDGESFTLERSLKGKDFRLYRCKMAEAFDTESEILKEKKSKNQKTSISEFLLKLCKLQDVQLRKNAKGKLRPISFRDISHLSLINEVRIYTEDSPVQATGQFTSKTVEESLFKYLITGVDDSSLIADPSIVQSNGSQQVRKETLQEIIETTENELAGLTNSVQEINPQLAKVDQALEETTTAITLNRDQLRDRQVHQKKLWRSIDKGSARLDVFARLSDRFNLLENYYQSDLKRLGAMSETGDFLSQLPRIACPICGTDDPWGSDEDLDKFKRACFREVERIQQLQQDLGSTMGKIQKEIDEVSVDVQYNKANYKEVCDQIDAQLIPSEKVIKNDLSELLKVQSRLEHASVLSKLLDRLREQQDQIDQVVPKTSSKPKNESAALTSETSGFCKVVATLLKEWKFPDSGSVTFSESKQDIVINGMDRTSHGKGIRALSYAAFTVALLRFCRKEKRPYFGVVVLDSPLVAYREPDSAKAVNKAGVKESFYRTLTKKRIGQQVIVFENEDPPKNITDYINYIHFSGDKVGKTRSGFFPIS